MLSAADQDALEVRIRIASGTGYTYDALAISDIVVRSIPPVVGFMGEHIQRHYRRIRTANGAGTMYEALADF